VKCNAWLRRASSQSSSSSSVSKMSRCGWYRAQHLVMHSGSDTSLTTFEASQVQVEELYSLEEEALQDLRCVAVFTLNSLCISDRQY
jgi:hypothetical protein